MPNVLYGLYDRRPAQAGKLFYVGIGSPTRPLQHLREARSERGHCNVLVQKVIDRHLTHGIAPEVRVLCVCNDRAYARLLEARLIEKIGRRGIGAGGQLCNRSRGYDDFGSDLPDVIAIKRSAATSLNNRLWADPAHRARRIAAMRGVRKTMTAEALKARRSALQLACAATATKSAAEIVKWSDPAYAARMAESHRKAWRNPSKRAAMLAGRSPGISASWRNPITRAKRIAGIRAAIARQSLKGAA